MDERGSNAKRLDVRDGGHGREADSAANMEQVRDLLFGTQVRESERRFARIEDRLAQEIGELRADTRKRLEAIEASVKSELSAFTRRIQDDRAARGSEQQGLARELAESTAALSRGLEQLRDEGARAASELSQELLRHAKSLSDDLARRLAEQAAAAQAELGSLRDASVPRSTLSTLFAELALHLCGDEPKRE